MSSLKYVEWVVMLENCHLELSLIWTLSLLLFLCDAWYISLYFRKPFQHVGTPLEQVKYTNMTCTMPGTNCNFWTVQVEQ